MSRKKNFSNPVEPKEGGVIEGFFASKKFIPALLVICAALILFTNQFVLLDFPSSADEYSYLISAQIFSQGKLSVPSHPLNDFFHVIHTLDDGKFYGKYPPGWPLFLMFGVLLGFPAIVNLIFGVLAIYITYLIGRDFFSEKTGKIAALLMATSPYLIMYSSTYYSQPATLLFVSLFTYLALRFSGEKGLAPNFLLGAVIGVVLIIRPFDAVIVLACFAVYNLYMAIRFRAALSDEVQRLVPVLAGFVLVGCIALAYNFFQTGDPLLMPFSKYDSRDGLGFGDGSYYVGKTLWWAVENNLFYRLVSLNLWVPFYAPLLLIAFHSRKVHGRAFLPLILIFLFFVAGYFFYSAPQFNSFGPRYIYPAAFALFILCALALEKIKSPSISAGPLIALFVVFNLLFLAYFSGIWHERILAKSEVYATVQGAGISNAIVFLGSSPDGNCAADSPCNDLTRNGTAFDGDVLYALDLKGRNSELMAHYPNRSYYLWSCKSIGSRYDKLLDFVYAKNYGCSLERIYHLPGSQQVSG
ncbi:MAG TPA: glycosyltransferase family 39 protein [archaeon]|nr:glycosyltransferase family 39 protein [archaeon]